MDELKQRLEGAVEKLFGEKIEVEVTPAPAETGADYATNVAMWLAKTAHKNPMEIAEQLAAEVGDERYEATVAKPGFLNFRLGDEDFAKKVEKLAEEVEVERPYAGKTVVAEFSDPNPFKVLHVGHLYTSIVGDSISRLLELAGAKVVRANFGGDVGLHVAKTLWALRRQFIDGLTIEQIAGAYVEGTRAYEEDETAKAEITELNKEIYRINAEDDHEGKLAELYWRGRELSYEYFDQFYARIGVKFDKYYPESSVAGRGLEEVREHVGEVYEESDGAIVFRGEKVGLHTRVFINREGVPTYEAKDVGLIFTKWDDWHFDESVVVTGNEQTEYMKVVLASVKEYASELVERTRHLTHGLVKLPGNVKMASRKGNFLKAVDVIDIVEQELAEASSDEARPKRLPSQGFGARPRRSSGSSSEELPPTPTHDIVTLAAIKYAFLKYKMGGDIVFDPQESVSTNGNSGVYLLYSVVRAKKILQKAESGAVAGRGAGVASETEVASVRALNKKLVQYEDVLREAVAGKAPYRVCAYLYELAQEFSRFYENVRVTGSERESELLVIVRAYVRVMEHGLGLLGITEIPEEM